MLQHVKIKGEWVRYDRRSRFKLSDAVLIGKSRETMFRGTARLHEREFYFYLNKYKQKEVEFVPPPEPSGAKTYTVKFDGKLNHLLESAIKVQEHYRAIKKTDTDFYFALTRMIDEGVIEREGITNDLEVYECTKPQF